MNGVGSGKTIKSGPNDHIFVYFTDHGAPGILGFGDTFLKASDLIKVGISGVNILLPATLHRKTSTRR
jgi:hypothetical protein